MSLKDICNFSTKQTELYDTPFGYQDRELFDKISESPCLEDRFFDESPQAMERFSIVDSDFQIDEIDQASNCEKQDLQVENANTGTFTHALLNSEKKAEKEEVQIKLAHSHVEPISMEELLMIVQDEISERGIDAVVEDCANHTFFGGMYLSF